MCREPSFFSFPSYVEFCGDVLEQHALFIIAGRLLDLDALFVACRWIRGGLQDGGFKVRLEQMPGLSAKSWYFGLLLSRGNNHRGARSVAR